MKPEPAFKFIAYAIIFLIAVTVSVIAIQNFISSTRGVTYLSPGISRPPMQFGVNADLEQYRDTDLQRTLAMMRDLRVTLVRQHFYWKEIEPRQGEFNWVKWDRIVARVNDTGLELIAVIDTTPVWARDLGEADLDYAPPKRADDYARFISEFARRYSNIRYLQIWDNPNVHPFWGRHNADPLEYAALLRTSAIAARVANPNVKIISAGLAPNGELIRGHPDYSDVLFLRELYEAGARDYFDIVGIKPYGMWSGPDDRRADKDIINFSRAIVLHDEMTAHGDGNKPIWAVEFGWNALPHDWSGAPSPWGTDTEQMQGARLATGIQRAQSEWSWMGAMIVQTFQPNVPSDNPLWGLSLVEIDFQPRAFYTTLANAINQPVIPTRFNFASIVAIIALMAIAVVFARRCILSARTIPWHDYWQPIESRFKTLPELAQLAILALAVIAFYYSPNTVLNFVLLALIVFLFALRLNLGLAITVFSVPFYLFPKNLIGSAQFSLVELLTLASVAAWALRRLTGETQSVISREPFDYAQDKLRDREISLSLKTRFPPALAGGARVASLEMTINAFRSKFRACDWAVLFFVLVALVSVKVAANFGVANREFRVIVLEPALLYGLIRVSTFSQSNLRRLIDALILSALAVSLIGLYQFFFTNWVIIGEGVRRILAVYGSPNNLALYLDRVLPIIIALAIFDNDKRRRVIYSLVAMPITACLYLTYSRAALLFGLPAALAFIALISGRRARIAAGALYIVGIIALVPLMQTERWQSLFQEGTGTGFFRISVWQSAIEMIRDHPVFGVGLDNFLYEYPKYIKPDAWREPNLSHAHNIILDFWTRMGIAGVIALVWMMVAFYREGVRSLSRFTREGGGEGMDRILVIALMAGMTATIAHGMIDAAYFFVDLAFVWMLMLGVMAQNKRLSD